MYTTLYTISFYILVLLKSTICQIPETVNPCVSKTTCHECIQTPFCAWCFSPTFNKERCFQPSGPNQQGLTCPEEYTYYPDNIQQIKQAENVGKIIGGGGGGGGTSCKKCLHESYQNVSQSSSSSSSSSWSSSSSSSSSSFSSHSQSNLVQITPQLVHLKLRARQAYTLKMTYMQAEDYPVDLYYLMDLSRSMADDKEKLSKLGSLLVETMTNITSNFQLGFGSFVDKVVSPYVHTTPKDLLAPCSGCAEPYGFKNVMKLSSNTKQFSRVVNEAHVSGNVDAPEGTFDAIMQAIVCRDQIGWRERARKLLVVSTDAGFHIACDGKLGGILTPNDASCHLNKKGLYTHSVLQDYPSIPQLNLKVKENAINVIFAVTEPQITTYRRLQTHVEGSSCGQLSHDSSNIVDLVKSQYEQISSVVELKDNASSALRVTYYSKCLNSTRPEKTNKCENVKIGDAVKFNITIELLACPSDPRDWNQTLYIYPVGLNESLTIDIEMLCSCPCELPGNPGYEEHSPKCSDVGTYKCGVCDCPLGYYGLTCQCFRGNTSSITDNCRPPNGTVDCSGRGVCECGNCECFPRPSNERIYGAYCQCDDVSCDMHEGQLCGGPDHGTCECGRCVCKPSWEGPACECKSSTESCYPPDAPNGPICSGNGVCECGVCKCHRNDTFAYSGVFCENCPTCDTKCSEYEDCVRCLAFQLGPIEEEDCASSCNKFHLEIHQEIDKNQENDILCKFEENNCTYYFSYSSDTDKKVHIKAEAEPECHPPVIVEPIIFAVIAAVVLMGLAIMLMWKLFTTIHDRREFAKFEKERMMARWDASENPIYKQATSTFKNPTYAGKG